MARTLAGSGFLLSGDRLCSFGSRTKWVLSVPRRLCYFMQRDGAVTNMVLRIFLRSRWHICHSFVMRR
jgi:hypothetical protein